MFAFLNNSFDLSDVNEVLSDLKEIAENKTSDIILIPIYIAASFTLILCIHFVFTQSFSKPSVGLIFEIVTYSSFSIKVFRI